MNRIHFVSILIFILSFLWGCKNANAQFPTSKPGSPVLVSIEATQTPQKDQPVDFVVTATTLFDTHNLVINVHPPSDMLLNSGALTWQGASSRGQAVTLHFNATFALETNQHVSVNAVVQSPSGARFSAQAVYTLTSPTQQKARSPQDKALHRLRHGRGVAVYPITK